MLVRSTERRVVDSWRLGDERIVVARAPIGEMRTFLIFGFVFSFLFLTHVASADPTGSVLVVEIDGDIDDPNALREAIGAELHTTAVSPDDPRVSSARGTLTIEA